MPTAYSSGITTRSDSHFYILSFNLCYNICVPLRVRRPTAAGTLGGDVTRDFEMSPYKVPGRPAKKEVESTGMSVN